MKNLLIALLFCLVVASCKSQTENKTIDSGEQSTEIEFQVKTTDPEWLEIFEDGYIPWISIKDAKAEIDSLNGKDDIVLEVNKAILVIDYPLNNMAMINLTSDDPKGFTRKELALKVSAEYHRIYAEEEESANTKTVPVEERQGLINRNPTDGKYGIWGHDIDDLDLSAIYVRKTDDGEIVLVLIVES